MRQPPGSGSDEDIAQKYIDNATTSAGCQFGTMVDSMTRLLELVGDWIASGKLSLSHPDALNDLLFPLLKRDRIICGISVADGLGKSYFLTAHGDGWRTRWIEGLGGQRQAVLRYWDAANQKVSEKIEPSTDDPRSRPWFFPALSSQRGFWTQPYIFFDRKVTGITGSIARTVNKRNSQVVVAFDILLDDLFAAIQRMALSENGRVVVFRNDTRIYVPGNEDNASDFLSPGEINDQLVRKMVGSWEKRQLPSGNVFFVDHDGQTWWCGFQAMDGANGNVWVAVMVPESDIIGGISQRRSRT